MGTSTFQLNIDINMEGITRASFLIFTAMVAFCIINPADARPQDVPALPPAPSIGPSVWDGVFLEQSETQPKLVIPESSGQDAAALAQDPNSSVWDGVFLDHQSGTQQQP